MSHGAKPGGPVTTGRPTVMSDDTVRANYVTWERVATAMITLLLAVIGFVGRGVVVNVDAMRDTMLVLNSTLTELKVELGRGQEKDAAIFRRLDRIEDKMESFTTIN